MAQVLELQPRERVEIDGRLLDSLCRRLGVRWAESFVIEKVEEISDRLAEIDWQHRQGLAPDIRIGALRIARLSAEVGLVSLAQVARDLAHAAARGDLPAYRAVWERLVRIGDRSLAQVWDEPGLRL